MRTGMDAVPAPDTFRVVRCAEHIYVHFAYSAASTAGGTPVCVNLEPVKGDLVEQRVKRSQRANPLAERAIEEYGERHDPQQDAALPGEQRPKTGADARIGD